MRADPLGRRGLETLCLSMAAHVATRGFHLLRLLWKAYQSEGRAGRRCRMPCDRSASAARRPSAVASDSHYSYSRMVGRQGCLGVGLCPGCAKQKGRQPKAAAGGRCSMGSTRTARASWCAGARGRPRRGNGREACHPRSAVHQIVAHKAWAGNRSQAKRLIFAEVPSPARTQRGCAGINFAIRATSTRPQALKPRPQRLDGLLDSLHAL